MKQQCAHRLVFSILLLWLTSICFATETTRPTDPNRYLNAVRTFADNVLKYGRDTYRPTLNISVKLNPLFVKC
jgi:hypothetical protein